MNTYPLEERYMLVLTPELAAAILVQDAMEDEKPALPEKILEAVAAGKTPWACASDQELFRILYEDGWASVPDAFDVIQDQDADTVYCSEFEGSAAVPDEFAKYGGTGAEYHDDYIAGLVPMKRPEMFKASYDSPEDLVQEFRGRLGGLAGPDVPVGRFVRDVSGTYYC